MKNMNRGISICAITALLTVTGCASTNGEKGVAIGAVVGALAAKGTGDHDNSRYAWGAILGAIAGGAIGTYMDKQEQEFKQELAGSGVKVNRVGNNIYLEMPGDITFSSNSAQIYSQFHQVLNDVSGVLNKYPKTYLHIDGHTDSSGSNNLNQSLSESRALSVKNYLVQQQVNRKRISTFGYGESQPIADNRTAAGKASNRRVELRIIPNS